MTIEALVKELQRENNTPWRNCASTNHLSLKNFCHHLIRADNGISDNLPRDSSGGEKSVRIQLLWGNIINDIFDERFQGRGISPKSLKKYWDDFFNASEKALKNVKWLHELLMERMSENPCRILDEITENLRHNFPFSQDRKENLKKLAGSFGFSCLYNWYYGKEEQEQDIWANSDKSLTQLEQAFPEYMYAAKVMLAVEPAELLARCVFAVSAQCWEENEEVRHALLRLLWLPDDVTMLDMAEKSPEAACYAARYFYCKGDTENTLKAVSIALDQKTDPEVFHLLLEDNLISMVYREGDSQTWNLFRQTVMELAKTGDAYANCLIGQALYHYWQDDFSEAQWLKEFLSKNDTESPENVAYKHFELGLQDNRQKQNQKLQAQCLFYMGKICEEQGESQQAKACYEKALIFKEDNPWAEKAEKAKRNVDLMARVRSDAKSKEVYQLPIAERSSNYVFIMGTSNPYQAFIRTLPVVDGGWNVVLTNTPTPPYPSYYSYMPCSASNQLYTLCKDLNWAVEQLLKESGGVPQILFAFFSEKQEDNVQQVTTLLVELSKRLEKIRKGFGRKQVALFHKALSGIRVYTSIESDYCANLLDSMQQMLYDQYQFYIPLNIVNRYTHAAQGLFTKYPLFMPFLNEKQSNRTLNLVVLGTGKCAMAVVREAMALPISNHPVIIHVVGKDAEHAKRCFQQNCPAVMSQSWLNDYVEVKFYSCPLDELPLYSAGDADELVSVLCSGDYYIAAADQDSINVELGIRLRESILSRGGNDFSSEPIIAAQCTDSMGALLMEYMRVQNRGGSDNWYSSYHILKFGTSDIFSWNELENGLIETRAKAVHLSYANIDPEEKEARYLGLQDYYLRYYNRSSSRSTAVSLVYRAFDAGKYLDKKEYGSPKDEAKLGKLYQSWLRAENNEKIALERLEKAACLEHIRWCLQLVSQGWQTATKDQVEAYIAARNPSHQLHIAKLHPYLVPWKKLGDAYSQVNKVWYQHHSTQLKDPRTTTKGSVEASTLFFKETGLLSK